MTVIDLFAGPGGWDCAAMVLGIDVLGIELDDAACRTRAAAGLTTMQADVAALNPMSFAPCRGLIASPPCQAFSMAGKGAGRKALSAYQSAAYAMTSGASIDVTQLDQDCEDPRGHLVLEPLRWALALLPEWIALEQVPPVLPVWEATAEALRDNGYATWTGVLSSERFGVPQTRQRAFLLARYGKAVSPPPVTHQRYVSPRRGGEQEMSLFDTPEPERIVLAEDRDLLPWVSMAEALDWGMTARPYPVIASGRTTGGPDAEKVGGSSARDLIYEERDAGRWTVLTRGDSGRDNDEFSAQHPSRVVTGKSYSWVRFRANAQSNAAERDVDEPAPTITGGHSYNERQWVVEYRRGGERINESTPVDDPAPTVTSRTDRWQVKEKLRAGTNEHDVSWTGQRPATTVAGDPRIAKPGHKGAVKTDPHAIPQMEGAVRVSLAEALVLQSFPADYPVQGTKTAQFRQIGDAVPPLMALAVLRAVT
jgi:DNA (cytosine-5)-methyltransferase 1